MMVTALCHEAEFGTTGRRLVQLLELGGGEQQFVTVSRSLRHAFGALATLVARPPRAVWVTQSSVTMSVALVAKLLRPRLRIVLDVGDLNVSLFRSTFGRVPLRVYVTAALERVCLRVSHGVVVRSPALRESLPARTHPKTRVIPDCWHEPRTQHRWQQHRFVVGMLGTIAWSEPMGWGYGFDLIEVLSRLPVPYTGLVIGDGPSFDALQKRAAATLDAERVSFLGRVGAPDLDAALAGCGIVLLAAPDVPAYAVRTTGKLPELIARQHPVVATRVGAAGELLANELLVEAWPHRSWSEVYDQLAARIMALVGALTWTDYDESLIAHFTYETYRPTVQALLA